MRNDIFSKVDNDVNNIKKENANIIETFKSYKNDFEKIKQNIK
jgi:archaellum component FlaC